MEVPTAMKTPSAYGWVYLEEGETFDQACRQIDKLMKKTPTRVESLSFGVSDFTENRTRAMRIAENIRWYIRQNYPSVDSYVYFQPIGRLKDINRYMGNE